ncbi:MAG: hypothetical protein H6644_18490 [Caldilineaceae bacterium]|nr:hypothetical protein [Caldilineaceae bacterium]
MVRLSVQLHDLAPTPARHGHAAYGRRRPRRIGLPPVVALGDDGARGCIHVDDPVQQRRPAPGGLRPD